MNDKNKKPTVSTSLETLITSRLVSSFKDKVMNKSTSLEVYNTIFSTVVEVFQQSSLQLSNETVNYIAQAYYDCVTINGGSQNMDPNIFTQRAKLENVKNAELALLFGLFKDTDMIAMPTLKELKRRS